VKFHDDPNQYTGTHQGKGVGTNNVPLHKEEQKVEAQKPNAPKQVA